jgi:hypothetical protein
MAVTPNKGYEQQVTGTNVDTWGDVLNNQVTAIIDNNLGGTVTKSLTNVPVNLNADESQALRLILNGTLTGDVLVTTLAVGMVIVDNQCTGNFLVTFQKNGVGIPIVLPNGTRNLISLGASGNPGAVGVEFPTGTRMPFQQSTVPVGWTKDTTTVGLDNAAMRLVTGSVVNGGNQNFTTAFANNRQPSGSVQPTVLDISQIPSHSHNITRVGDNNFDTNQPPAGSTGGGIQLKNEPVSFTGGGQSHTHGLSMNTMDFGVRFFDFTIGVKQ